MKGRVNMAINIEEFSKRFGEEYYNLYEGKTVVKDYRGLIETGDEFIRNHPEFVGEVINYRHDFISSDREVAAFMLAVKALNIEKELNAQNQERDWNKVYASILDKFALKVFRSEDIIQGSDYSLVPRSNCANEQKHYEKAADFVKDFPFAVLDHSCNDDVFCFCREASEINHLLNRAGLGLECFLSELETQLQNASLLNNKIKECCDNIEIDQIKSLLSKGTKQEQDFLEKHSALFDVIDYYADGQADKDVDLSTVIKYQQEKTAKNTQKKHKNSIER